MLAMVKEGPPQWKTSHILYWNHLPGRATRELEPSNRSRRQDSDPEHKADRHSENKEQPGPESHRETSSIGTNPLDTNRDQVQPGEQTAKSVGGEKRELGKNFGFR